MVWGMERIGSGMFGPHGSFPGEQARLEAIGHQMSPEEKAKYGSLGYAAYVNESIIKDNGPLPDQALPKRFVANQRYNTLGSLLGLPRKVRAVDESLKNIIERLEPGVHQFWPLQIVMPNGDEHPVQYYGMIVLHHLESFLPEESDPDCWRGGEIAPGIRSYTVYGSSKEAHAGLAMASKVFGSSHIWRERDLTDPVLLFSDELQTEIKNAGLRIPKHFKLKAV
jgi:hypothetical protein